MEFSEVEARVLRYLEQRLIAGGVQGLVALRRISLRTTGLNKLRAFAWWLASKRTRHPKEN